MQILFVLELVHPINFEGKVQFQSEGLESCHSFILHGFHYQRFIVFVCSSAIKKFQNFTFFPRSDRNQIVHCFLTIGALTVFPASPDSEVEDHFVGRALDFS